MTDQPLEYSDSLRMNRRWLQLFLIKLIRLPAPIRSVLFFGGRRYCVICRRYAAIFLPHGIKLRLNARCPFCGSLERHRLTWLTYRRLVKQPAQLRMLHFAPEPCLQFWFRKLHGSKYLSADFAHGRAMIVEDLTRLTLPSENYDLVCCNHVLEHIFDDQAALREIHRVLVPTGVALLQVPLRNGPTLEDPTITSALGREEVFGQHDHVRHYGHDFPDRCRRAGFSVTTVSWAAFGNKRVAERLGILCEDLLFMLRRT